VREVPGSNHSGTPVILIEVVREFPNVKLGHDLFVALHFQFIIDYHAVIPCLTDHLTYSNACQIAYFRQIFQSTCYYHVLMVKQPVKFNGRFVNVVTCMSESRRGFGFYIRFVYHFNTRLVNTLNYSAIANFHPLLITSTSSRPAPGPPSLLSNL
jgi:hypothetical protein